MVIYRDLKSRSDRDGRKYYDKHNRYIVLNVTTNLYVCVECRFKITNRNTIYSTTFTRAKQNFSTTLKRYAYEKHK